MKHDARFFWTNLLLVCLLLSILWVVKAVEWWNGADFGYLGILPQHINGLKGILFSPFIHGSFEHLSSNTAALALLLVILLNAYPKVALRVLLFTQFLSGMLVWALTTPTAYHVGASGVIYGVAAFLISSGLIRKDRQSTTIALLVALFYGSMAGGFFPKEGISWQSHLWGAISGVIIALVFRHNNLPDPEQPDIAEEESGHFFDNPSNTAN